MGADTHDSVLQVQTLGGRVPLSHSDAEADLGMFSMFG